MKRKPTGNRNFTPTAKRVNPVNRWIPTRGGIRL